VSAYTRYIRAFIVVAVFSTGVCAARGERTLVVNPGSGVTTAVEIGYSTRRLRPSLPNARGLKARILRRSPTAVKLRIDASRKAAAGPRTLTLRVPHGRIRVPLYVPFSLPDAFPVPDLTAGLAKTIELPTAGVNAGLRVSSAAPCRVSAGAGSGGFGRAVVLSVTDRKTARFRLISTDNSEKHVCRVSIQERLDNRYDGRARVSTLRVQVKPDRRVPASLATPRPGRVTAAANPRLRWSEVRHANAWEVLIRPRSKHATKTWQTLNVENGKRVRGLKAGRYEWKVRAHYRQPGGILDVRSKFSKVGRFRVKP